MNLHIFINIKVADTSASNLSLTKTGRWFKIFNIPMLVGFRVFSYFLSD